MPGDHRPRLHVVAGAIFNAAGKVLITRRADHVHQGSRWEFPGGKLDAGENVRDGLARELREELGITVDAARPLIRIPYDYPDLSVLLDVWRVDRFNGVAHGREGQPLAWVHLNELPQYAFPAANQPIITAVQLPEYYLITPPGAAQADNFLAVAEQAIARGIRLIQFRDKTLAPERYRAAAEALLALCKANQVQLLLNAEPELVTEIAAHGVHLSSERLMACHQRPLAASFLVAASCHNAEELRQAAAIGVDVAVLGPVNPTQSHAATPPMGWSRFAELCDQVSFPVYALGGLQQDDLATAFSSGAQGIAAIRGLWPNDR